MASTSRVKARLRRKKRVRKALRTCERPMLTVYRSTRHLYAQLYDPIAQRTITGTSTRSPKVNEGLKSTKDVEAAKKLGSAIASLALERNIREVSFNRNGFVYVGRIKALADAAREAGLKL